MTTTMNSTFSQYKCAPTYSSCFQRTVFFQNQFVIIFQTHYKFTSLQIREQEYKELEFTDCLCASLVWQCRDLPVLKLVKGEEYSSLSYLRFVCLMNNLHCIWKKIQWFPKIRLNRQLTLKVILGEWRQRDKVQNLLLGTILCIALKREENILIPQSCRQS